MLHNNWTISKIKDESKNLSKFVEQYRANLYQPEQSNQSAELLAAALTSLNKIVKELSKLDLD